MILLGSLNLVFMCGLNFLFLTFLFNFLLKMMKKKLLRTISVNAAHVFKRPFVLPKSVLNLIFPRLNCCKIRNICLYVIFIVSSVYRCTSHAFLLLSGGELQQLFMSVHLARWFILADISISTFSADHLPKVIEFSPPFSSLIAKGSWSIHWKKYRSFVNYNCFFFAVKSIVSTLWCQPGTQEYCEALFLFSSSLS